MAIKRKRIGKSISNYVRHALLEHLYQVIPFQVLFDRLLFAAELVVGEILYVYRRPLLLIKKAERDNLKEIYSVLQYLFPSLILDGFDNEAKIIRESTLNLLGLGGKALSDSSRSKAIKSLGWVKQAFDIHFFMMKKQAGFEDYWIARGLEKLDSSERSASKFCREINLRVEYLLGVCKAAKLISTQPGASHLHEEAFFNLSREIEVLTRLSALDNIFTGSVPSAVFLRDWLQVLPPIAIARVVLTEIRSTRRLTENLSREMKSLLETGMNLIKELPRTLGDFVKELEGIFMCLGSLI